MCISEVLWSWCNFQLTSSGFTFYVAASGIFPDVQFVLTYISMRIPELAPLWCLSSCQESLPGEIITSSRESKPQECFEHPMLPRLPDPPLRPAHSQRASSRATIWHHTAQLREL